MPNRIKRIPKNSPTKAKASILSNPFSLLYMNNHPIFVYEHYCISSLLSLLAAFEVFSIPAGNGIIDLFSLVRIDAAAVWFGVAITAGFIALILHREEIQ